MFVNIDEIVAEAQTTNTSASVETWNIWKQWIWRCILQLGIGDDSIKVCQLNVKDYMARLPEDCRDVIEVSLFDAAGCQLAHQFKAGKARIYQDDRLLLAATTGNSPLLNQLVPVDVSNDQYNIHLGTNGANVATILIRYFAYPLDQNGQPLVDDRDVEACLLYIQYKQSQRDKDGQGVVEANRNAWMREADRARARKKMSSMTPDKAKYLLRTLASQIPNFRSIEQF